MDPQWGSDQVLAKSGRKEGKCDLKNGRRLVGCAGEHEYTILYSESRGSFVSTGGPLNISWSVQRPFDNPEF